MPATLLPQAPLALRSAFDRPGRWHLEDARILVVDDEEANLSVLRRVLAAAGFNQVFTEQDGRLVVQRFLELAPDLVLLDLHLPGRDGFAILEEIGNLSRGEQFVPVLVLTGDHAPETRQRALALGAKDFLNKPFDLSETLLRIRNLVETRFLYRELAGRNERLEVAVQERTRELHDSQVEMLERLAAAAEFRDDETGDHTRRVGRLAADLAERLGQSPREVELLRRAAPLHDVGKIGIPDRILLKPDRLTPEEFDIIKQHTIIGARILARGRSPLLQLAERIALSHHERWDGTGYPNGVAGSNIPLEARIVAVADFYDALTNTRPYRPALPKDRVRAMVRAGRGSHFDPVVVDAFEEIL
ncbi:MAG TPA: HD domain-containing phosphohydrolase [Gemmatimonadales bacterium]|jgi:putative two-component system response regulator|nr:HD domain-containing phosphohydrolase [Gemmatimonadales bacterium]